MIGARPPRGRYLWTSFCYEDAIARRRTTSLRPGRGCLPSDYTGNDNGAAYLDLVATQSIFYLGGMEESVGRGVFVGGTRTRSSFQKPQFHEKAREHYRIPEDRSPLAFLHQGAEDMIEQSLPHVKDPKVITFTRPTRAVCRAIAACLFSIRYRLCCSRRVHANSRCCFGLSRIVRVAVPFAEITDTRSNRCVYNPSVVGRGNPNTRKRQSLLGLPTRLSSAPAVD